VSDKTVQHDEVETLRVDVVVPEHDAREGASALFTRTRKKLIDREGGRCWVCNRTAEEAGHPLEAHHHPIERCFAEMVDWELVAADARAGHLGPYAQAFDWDDFLAPLHLEEPQLPGVGAKPFDPYAFVDDMTVNGLLLCKDHHTVGDEGIHTLPGPIFLAQKYGKEGYKFSAAEVIHHAT